MYSVIRCNSSFVIYSSISVEGSTPAINTYVKVKMSEIPKAQVDFLK